MSYQALPQPAVGNQSAWNALGAMDFSNTLPASPQKPGMNNTTQSGYNSSQSSWGADPSRPARSKSWMSIDSLFGRRGARPVEISSPPWRHPLNEKRLRNVPTDSETTRYFDRSRQTRRVFLDCFKMWLITAVICAGLAGTLAGFSSLDQGISQGQKYAYNALVTGLSIVLGLAFAAQFKQYCEMLRWRFLASAYRTIDDFEDILSCDSWRTTFRLIFRARKAGSWIPTKAQLLALIWLLIFIAFNVFVALIGLTYSIDVSDSYSWVQRGNVSVLDLSYISSSPQEDPANYDIQFQEAAAATWGTVGQNFNYWPNQSIDDIWAPIAPVSYSNEKEDVFWYRFIDLSPDQTSVNVVTPRTINATATCEEYTILEGGYAGFNRPPGSPEQNLLVWQDLQGRNYSSVVNNAATGGTTWMTNATSVNESSAESGCGARCAQILVLQTALNETQVSTGWPRRLWSCNNTLTQVTYEEWEGFADPERLFLPDLQARIMAGAIGLTGIRTIGDDLQYNRVPGDNGYNPGPVEGDTIAALIMLFSTSALSAMDSRGAPRMNVTGDYSPSPAQIVNVKWNFAGAILAGIPVVQFLMLLAVVFFSSKAIILEPSYLTAARLMYPVLQKLGPNGVLLDVDEVADELGPDYKIAYAVRPKENDPGYHDKEFVRELTVVREDEGYGYIRGAQPTGRYD